MLENIFFKLLKKYFGKNHKYNKIFNKNKMEISYSYMDKVTKNTNSHNKYIASRKDQANQNLSNWQNPNNCPFDNKCLTSKIFYSAEIITNNQQPSKVYLEISKTEFKIRFHNHQISSQYWQNKKDTELSKYIWELKDKHMEYQIKWFITQKLSS